jgi:hypothetical protein
LKAVLPMINGPILFIFIVSRFLAETHNQSSISGVVIVATGWPLNFSAKVFEGVVS